VVEAILAKDESAVLTALASNETAQISPEGLRRLVDKAREVVALRSPLARHPNLSSDLAEQLYLLGRPRPARSPDLALPARSRPRWQGPSRPPCGRPSRRSR
jgi:hypothetical protein